MKFTRYLANLITLLRIVGTAVLLFLPLFSVPFYAVYTLTGVTDVLDGAVARATGTAGEFGAKLDSVADLFFYTVLLLRLIRYLIWLLPPFIWWLVAGILLIRLGAYAVAAVKYHRFATLHTYLNKLTGFSLFLLPYFLLLPFGKIYCFIVCAIGFLASLEELILHLIRHRYNPEVKSLVFSSL